MIPTTPSKKLFSDGIKSSIDASNAPRDALIPEDLNLALQNIGSRVRKSVTEGYITPRHVPFSTPATPFSSPAKPSTSKDTPPTPIFRSASDAFNSVYASRGSQLPLTPSPRKRPRDATDLGTYNDEVALEWEEDEEEVTVIWGPDATSGGAVGREIKPLKRTRTSSSLVDPFSCAAETMDGSSTFSTDSMEVCGEATT